MFDMISSIFKNLASKPATRAYPHKKREPFDRARGKVEIEMDTCIFCGICSRKCPSDAIIVNKAEKSWQIDPFKCIICGECEIVCPKKCIHMAGQYNTPAYSKSKSKHIQQPKPVPEAKPEADNTQETA